MDTIATAEIRHLDVRAVAEREGCETVGVQTFEHPEHEGADWTLYVYDLPSGCRAAVSNGDACWDQNPDYLETLEEYGLGADLTDWRVVEL